MEPEALTNSERGAPIVGWTRPSASLVSGLASPAPSEDTVVEELLSSYAEHNNNAPPIEVKFDVPPEDSLITGSGDSSEYEGDDDEGQGSGRRIPDGGWGWVIVACSLVISLIADGISYSFGIVYTALLNHFQESQAVTAWIGSLFLAVPLLSGPVCSALVDRFGCRAMTIAGAIISCLGFVLSSFTTNILVMYFTFGVVAGLGLGLCYVTAVVSIAFWFDKKRSLANGLGACGSGLGTFLYAPFCQFLIDEYNWRGALLILGGTLFNMAVCGALMREPEWFSKENRGGSSVATKSRGGSSRNSVLGNSESDFPGVEELRKMLQSSDAPHLVPICVTTLGRNSVPNGDLMSPNFQSVINLPTFIKHNEKVPVEVLEALKTNPPVYNAIVENYPHLALSRSFSDRTLSGSRSAPPTEPGSPISKPKDPITAHSPLLSAGSPKSRKPTRQSSMPGYLRNIRVRRNSVMYRGAMLNIKKYRLKASSCPDIFKNSMTTLAKENQQSWRKEAMDLCRDMADFSMFLDFHFLLVSIATMLVYTFYIVPYFYLPEFMRHENYSPQEATNALAVIGITTMLGMVALGWLGDQPWVSVSKTFSICLLGTGLMTIAMPIFMCNYYVLMVVSGGFGLFFASVYSFTPPLIVQIIPLDRFTTAYGLSLLCQGIGNLVGPPIAGWIFDETKSWHLAFHLAGIGLVVSCLLVLVIPYTSNRQITFSLNPNSIFVSSSVLEV